MARSSAAGTSARTEEMLVGGCVNTVAQTSATVRPRKGGAPAMSSCRTAPIAQMSARSSCVRGLAKLLRGHVATRPHHVGPQRDASTRLIDARIDRFGEAEVDDLDARAPVGAAREKEIRRLEVAVNDAVRVGLGDRLGGLEDPVDRGRNGDRSPVGHDLLEVVPLEVLEHQIRRAALERPDVEHAHHVLALDARGHASFTHEAPDDFAVAAAHSGKSTLMATRRSSPR